MTTLIQPGDLITRAWQNFYKNIRVYADFGLWLTLISVAHWGLMILTRSFMPGQLAQSAVLVVLSLPLWVVLMAFVAAIIDATAKCAQGKPVDERASISVGMHKVIPFIWVSFLTGLTLIGGLIMLIVPFFIFVVWFRFSQNFTVVDDIRGTSALRASKKLSSGRWGAVFVRIALPAIFFYVMATFVDSVLYLAVGTAMGDVGMFFGPTSNTALLSPSQLFVSTVLPAAVNAFLTLPLLTSSDVILWLDLKRTMPA